MHWQEAVTRLWIPHHYQSILEQDTEAQTADEIAKLFWWNKDLHGAMVIYAERHFKVDIKVIYLFPL